MNKTDEWIDTLIDRQMGIYIVRKTTGQICRGYKMKDRQIDKNYMDWTWFRDY